MKNDFENVEQMLRTLPLQKAPASLDGLVGKVLHRRRRRILPWALAGAVAAAAAVVIAMLPMRQPQTAEKGSGTFLAKTDTPDPGLDTTKKVPDPFSGRADAAAQPVRVEETFSNLIYEGLRIRDGKTPVRMFRRRRVERTWLIDPQSGYTVETAVPHDQVVLINAEVY